MSFLTINPADKGEIASQVTLTIFLDLLRQFNLEVTRRSKADSQLQGRLNAYTKKQGLAINRIRISPSSRQKFEIVLMFVYHSCYFLSYII